VAYFFKPACQFTTTVYRCGPLWFVQPEKTPAIRGGIPRPQRSKLRQPVALHRENENKVPGRHPASASVDIGAFHLTGFGAEFPSQAVCRVQYQPKCPKSELS
jgi:hypothetical protein